MIRSHSATQPSALRHTRCALLLLALSGMVACSDESNAGPTEQEDLPMEVTAQVGKTGATLRARGVTLTIPAGALDKAITHACPVRENLNHSDLIQARPCAPVIRVIFSA